MRTLRVLGILLVAGATAGCGDDRPNGRDADESSTADAVYPGTERMVARLADQAGRVDPSRNIYLNEERIASLRSNPMPSDPAQAINLRGLLAQELANAAEYEAAAAVLDTLEVLVEEAGEAVPAEWFREVRSLRALVELRKHWEAVCVGPGMSRNCLIPRLDDEPAGATDGLERAASIYTDLLTERPDNLSWRWLLNLTHMGLGTYPGGVPERWRVPAEVFDSGWGDGPWVDVAAEWGLNTVGLAGGSILDDFDGDGDLDIMASSWDIHDPLRYFENLNGEGFRERTEEAGLTGLNGGLNMLQADYDNDGDLDVYVLRGAWFPQPWPNSLLRNEGDGRFVDVTDEALLLRASSTQTAAWGDFDNDGWIDLFVGNETAGRNRSQGELYRNNGDGTFTNVAGASRITLIGFVKAVLWTDYDNDGRLDLYVSFLDAPNRIYHNEGPDEGGTWRFRVATEETGLAEPTNSFPGWFFDYDNDGWEDLFISAYRSDLDEIAAEYLGIPHDAETGRLLRNQGDGTFRDVTREEGLDHIFYAMGSNFGDLDMDGWLDIYIGTGDPDIVDVMPSRMFRNDSDDGFHEVSASLGMSFLFKGHGVSFGDVDGDGDQDIFNVYGGAHQGDQSPDVMLINPGYGNRTLTLKLEGTRANRAAIGSRVRIRVREAGELRDIYRTVNSGGSFGANSLQLEVGLGQAEAVVEVEIRWAGSGTVEILDGLQLDGRYRIVEGEGRAVPLG